jgi:hypothetical protein
MFVNDDHSEDEIKIYLSKIEELKKKLIVER